MNYIEDAIDLKDKLKDGIQGFFLFSYVLFFFKKKNNFSIYN